MARGLGAVRRRRVRCRRRAKHAALLPGLGSEKVARMFLGGLGKLEATLTGEPIVVNGNPALVLRPDGVLDGVLDVRVEGACITGLCYVRNPQKPIRVESETSLTLAMNTGRRCTVSCGTSRLCSPRPSRTCRPAGPPGVRRTLSSRSQQQLPGRHGLSGDGRDRQSTEARRRPARGSGKSRALARRWPAGGPWPCLVGRAMMF